MLSDRAILQHLARQPKQAAGLKQLIRELGLHGQERGELEERLQRLVQRGELIEVESGRYALPRAAAGRNLVAGRLTMHRDGYGFVIPESAELKERISGDIYIPPPAMGAAMHGDRVLVEIGPVRSDGRAEGRIVRVAGRAHPTVVGTFHYGARRNYVVPIDEKITQEIDIPPGQEWPPSETAAAPEAGEGGGKPRESRHRVIGAEARRRALPQRERLQTDQWDDLEGVVVDVEITQWPGPTQPPRGRVVEILGYEDDFGVDVEIIIRKHHIPHRFPDAVLHEAQRVEEIVPARELRCRHDFRRLPIVTIDGETARDFDDAVTVQRLPNGHFELQVHIADVAHYVLAGMAIDGEAQLRGTSVYFPDRAVPMLPLELSTDICSLRPHLDRLVLSCIMELDPRGEVLGYELSEGVIRSAERMTYTDVNALLAGDEGLRQRYAPLVATFELMRDLALLLNRQRVRRGSIDFDLPEPVIEFDEYGLMRGVTRSERNVAHRLIEEFMLAANECVAAYLEQKGIASLYRIHERPDAKKVFEFETTAAAFGYSLGVGALPVQRVQPRADRRSARGTGRHVPTVEIPQDVRITPHMYQKLTQKIAGKPEERILSYLMLRSLKQARYAEENVGHFALAAPAYTHFTSPIRRYPDLIVHRILKQVLRESAEEWHGEVGVGRGVPVARPYSAEAAAEPRSPWSREPGQRARHPRQESAPPAGPIAEDELHPIADQSSQTERRADDAERELLEWKKIKFMQERVGEEFAGMIVSVTRFGLFVELADLFIEGLVPLATLTGDRYTFRENTRQIIGERSRRTFSLGDKVRVWVDRIDRMQKRIQFALAEAEPTAHSPQRQKRRRAT